MARSKRVGLVLSGGGARGAYEAGVMSVLIPALDERGERPRIYIGTSVGAINASYLASSMNVDAQEAVKGGNERWRQVNKSRVVRPILLRQAPLTVARYAGEILSLPGVRLPSLLDPKPLERNLRRWIDWDDVHKNVEEDARRGARLGRDRGADRSHGRVRRGTRRARRPPLARDRLRSHPARRAARARLRRDPDPVPAGAGGAPRAARGWYFDGGTRLNTPIKPALDLGAEKLIVVATDSIAEPSKRPGRHESGPPDFGDGALHVLQGMLVDPVVEDMRILGNINMFFTEQNGRRQDRRGAPGRRLGDGAEAAKRYRKARGKPPYRCVPYIFIAPEKARRDRPPRARRLPGPLRRHQGDPSLARLPAAQPAAGRREPDARRASQLPLLRRGVHRGADQDGPARRPPLAALGSGSPAAVADPAARRIHAAVGQPGFGLG